MILVLGAPILAGIVGYFVGPVVVQHWPGRGSVPEEVDHQVWDFRARIATTVVAYLVLRRVL